MPQRPQRRLLHGLAQRRVRVDRAGHNDWPNHVDGHWWAEVAEIN